MGGGDIYSHATNRLGHKGLFFDRLDGRPEQDPSVGNGAFDLLPRARGLFHVRNRSLDPVQGRWIQADPLGTAACEQLVNAYDDFNIAMGGEEVSIDDLFRDGQSRHQYIASQPVDLFDPAGTFFSAVDALGGATTASELRNEWSEDIVDHAQTIQNVIGAAFDAIAIMQMSDSEWALDWESSDADYFTAGEAAHTIEFGPEVSAQNAGAGLTNANLLPGQERYIRGLANASRHGSKLHRMGMATLVIDYLNKKGIPLKNVDISFNRSPFKGSGIRVDPLVRDKKTGKLLMVGEVAVSQTVDDLKDRMAKLRKLLKKAGLGGTARRRLPR